MIQGYASEYDTVEDDFNKVTFYISGMFNLSYGIGTFISPLISPLISKSLGFRGYTDLFAFLCIVGLIIFLALSSIPLFQKHEDHKIKRGFIKENSNINESLREDFLENQVSKK